MPRAGFVIIVFKIKGLLFTFWDILEKHREIQKETSQVTFSLLVAKGVFIAICCEIPSSYFLS